MSYPDHNTINRFRSDRLKGVLKELWAYAESVAREELEHNEPDKFGQIDRKE